MTTDPAADKLSVRKATLLAVVANGEWVDMLRLLRRLRRTGEFEELTKKTTEIDFRLTNDMIGLSQEGYLTLGRHKPRACVDCSTITPFLFVVAELNNGTWDGSEASLTRQSSPRCGDCFERLMKDTNLAAWLATP